MNETNVLPDVQTAYSTVFRKVHHDVFFRKLAAASYPVETPQQMEQLLLMAGKLRVAKEAEAVKLAEASNDPYAAANAALDAAMTQRGYPGVKQASMAEENYAANRLASHYETQGDIYNSVLVLKQAEALQYAEQNGLLPMPKPQAQPQARLQWAPQAA